MLHFISKTRIILIFCILIYRGKLDNANMLVSVPKDRGFLPNESVKQAANKLANLAANPFGSQLLSLRAYSEDGCAVYELLEVKVFVLSL